MSTHANPSGASSPSLLSVPDSKAASAQHPPLAHQSTAASGRLVPQTPTVLSSIKAIAWKNLYFNIAVLIFFPLGLISHSLEWGSIVTFVLNFCAIIPLAKTLDFATDQLSMRVGQTIGGLLNASFGNAVELILGILTLKAGLLRVLQASLIGSILSNLLLVLGFCFFLGGLVPFGKNRYQSFDEDNANLDTGLLSVVVLGFIVPAALHSFISTAAEGETFTTADEELHNMKVVTVSRGAAIVLLLTYGMFLIFHLYTNPEGLQNETFRRPGKPRARSILSTGQQVEEPQAASVLSDDEEEEVPVTTAAVALGSLCVSTVLIAIAAEFLVDSIDGLAKSLPETFIGIVILPIVGNAAEHLTAVSSALRGKMDLAIEVSVGSSMQIALFVTPLLVLVGWIINQPLTLDFQTFETAVLFASVFVVNSLIQDGRCHWLEGWMLLASYLIIAIAFYYV